MKYHDSKGLSTNDSKGLPNHVQLQARPTGGNG